MEWIELRCKHFVCWTNCRRVVRRFIRLVDRHRRHQLFPLTSTGKHSTFVRETTTIGQCRTHCSRVQIVRWFAFLIWSSEVHCGGETRVWVPFDTFPFDAVLSVREKIAWEWKVALHRKDARHPRSFVRLLVPRYPRDLCHGQHDPRSEDPVEAQKVLDFSGRQQRAGTLRFIY